MTDSYYNTSRWNDSSFIEDIFHSGWKKLCFLGYENDREDKIIHSISFLKAFSKIASKKEIEVIEHLHNNF